MSPRYAALLLLCVLPLVALAVPSAPFGVATILRPNWNNPGQMYTDLAHVELNTGKITGRVNFDQARPHVLLFPPPAPAFPPLLRPSANRPNFPLNEILRKLHFFGLPAALCLLQLLVS